MTLKLLLYKMLLSLHFYLRWEKANKLSSLCLIPTHDASLNSVKIRHRNNLVKSYKETNDVCDLPLTLTTLGTYNLTLSSVCLWGILKSTQDTTGILLQLDETNNSIWQNENGFHTLEWKNDLPQSWFKISRMRFCSSAGVKAEVGGMSSLQTLRS